MNFKHTTDTQIDMTQAGNTTQIKPPEDFSSFRESLRRGLPANVPYIQSVTPYFMRFENFFSWHRTSVQRQASWHMLVHGQPAVVTAAKCLFTHHSFCLSAACRHLSKSSTFVECFTFVRQGIKMIFQVFVKWSVKGLNRLDMCVCVIFIHVNFYSACGVSDRVCFEL